MKKRTLLVVVLTVAMTAALIGPVSAAITRFTDVPDTNIFASDILWMDENEITTGCGTDLFCPGDEVTREQMSAFLHRLATKQVVDAGALEGKAAADFAADDHDHDTSYAATGHDHNTDYLAIDGTAADSELVGGLAPSDMMRVATWSFDTLRKPDDFARLGNFDIEAPTDGFLMLSSSLQGRTTGTTESLWCAFSLDNGTTWPSGSVTREDMNAAPSTEECSAQIVVPVEAGTHTITVMAFINSLLDSDFAWGTASALFVPFDGAGQMPTSFTPAVAKPNQAPDFSD